MEPGSALNEAMEELSLLLEELGISSGLFYQSLFPTMTGLRSGRSPQALGLEEKLRQAQDYLTILRQVLPEFEKSFSQIKNNLAGKDGATKFADTWVSLDKETHFYRQFQEASGNLLQRLNLIAQEGRLSPLGRMPIDEVWEEIERMVNKG